MYISAGDILINDMDVEALVFDLGNVIVLSNLEQVRRALVCDNPKREYLPWGEPHWLEQINYESGKLTTQEFLIHIQERTGLQIEEAEFINGFEPIFHLNEPLARLIPNLSRKYPLVLLSNTNEIHWKACESRFAELFSYFKEILLSFKIGMLKPHRDLFLMAAAATGCPVESCLFIDDTEAYVKAAQAVGLQSILYTGFETIDKLRVLL